MKLGFVSAILPDLSLEQVVRFAAAEGFECVELMCWPRGKAERRYAGVTHVDVAALTAEEAARVNDVFTSAGVTISGLGYYPNPLAPDRGEAQIYIDHIRRVIEAARVLGVGVVNTFVGRDWTRSVEENWPRFLEVWKPLVQFATDKGVKIGIENCPMLFSRDEWPGGKNLATTPAIWQRMFADIPSPNFGLNYDPSHLVLQQMDPISPFSEFEFKFFHLHAKDMIVHPESLNEVGIFAFPGEWHTPRIPGLGTIDWAQFMAALYEVGYDGPVCIEVEDPTFGNTLKGRKQALRVARNVLEPYF